MERSTNCGLLSSSIAHCFEAFLRPRNSELIAKSLALKLARLLIPITLLRVMVVPPRHRGVGKDKTVAGWLA